MPHNFITGFLCELYMYKCIFFAQLTHFSHLSNWPGRKYLHFKMNFTQRRPAFCCRFCCRPKNVVASAAARKAADEWSRNLRQELRTTHSGGVQSDPWQNNYIMLPAGNIFMSQEEPGGHLAFHC